MNPIRLALIVKLKAEKRLTEFTAPADMKGTKVLVLSPTQMYVYLPAFGKVRAMTDEFGRSLQKAGPSTPVEILGLDGVPEALPAMAAFSTPGVTVVTRL